MLSSQTKDQTTHATMLKLREYGLTPKHIQETSDEKLGELICKVGFWTKKVKYIKKTTDILLEKYDGDIPDTIEELVKLPGVGPKMGYLALKVAWNKIDGIGVDVHVHRISNRLEWVHTNTPEQTRVALEAWLPKQYWFEINLLLVGFGQQICKGSPKCSECKLRNMCPSSKYNVSSDDIEDLWNVCFYILLKKQEKET
ncbi:uncharacterized protein [Blastocystis hominis]|uniref:DNA-(apurinic or apyrimidinic site) lyase n=1 Tax=Blastocystis hominis TaxID=12968 RepID=D8LVP1_BLAHO|nr:uncharacterized protein [Blastocystis hominis]CBK19880.2 unnamed protein product [Blastocystis hominis]|eukprot:XP_012893928.1 uncharacterized protein [Blastocystis hominis]